MEGSQSQISFMLDQIVIGNAANGKITQDSNINPYDDFPKPKKVNFDAMLKSSIEFGNYEGKGLLDIEGDGHTESNKIITGA